MKSRTWSMISTVFFLLSTGVLVVHVGPWGAFGVWLMCVSFAASYESVGRRREDQATMPEDKWSDV